MEGERLWAISFFCCDVLERILKGRSSSHFWNDSFAMFKCPPPHIPHNNLTYNCAVAVEDRPVLGSRELAAGPLWTSWTSLDPAQNTTETALSGGGVGAPMQWVQWHLINSDFIILGICVPAPAGKRLSAYHFRLLAGTVCTFFKHILTGALH